MSMVIRTLYNNKSWEDRCTAPYKDVECASCFKINPFTNERMFMIKQPNRTDEECSGDCWERSICTEYRWGCTPKGKTFGKRAYPGMKVFFVYGQPDGNYTLWGKTTIQSIDDRVLEQGEDFGEGYAYIHLTPFQPLPKEQWVRNLTDHRLVGEKWLMGRYRYLNASQESFLEDLIGGAKVERQVESPPVTPYPHTLSLKVSLTSHMDNKLTKIAHDEGRQKEEIIREAIAEWIRQRGL